MPDAKYERLPQAGDTEKQLGLDIVYLAPKPVPTGQAAINIQNTHRAVNEVYLDFAYGTGQNEFGNRVALGTLISLVLTFFLFSGVGAWFRMVDWGEPFFRTWGNDFFGNWIIWLVFLFFALMFASIFAYAAYQETRYPPTRFNRQRREVCYVPAKGEPAFIPWEEVIACVSVEQDATQFGVTQRFALRLGFRDTKAGQMYWLTSAQHGPMFAIGQWEALRLYMEQGPSAVPPPPPAEYEEGTLAFFHYVREGNKSAMSAIGYGFWCLGQFLTGWTIPCRVAEWFSLLPQAGFPKAVRDWSKPLPPEQWAKSSAELLQQSEELQAAYKKGQSFMQHFNLDLAGPANTPPPPAKTKGRGKRKRARENNQPPAQDMHQQGNLYRDNDSSTYSDIDISGND
jgi:hypothetical protein